MKAKRKQHQPAAINRPSPLTILEQAPLTVRLQNKQIDKTYPTLIIISSSIFYIDPYQLF